MVSTQVKTIARLYLMNKLWNGDEIGWLMVKTNCQYRIMFRYRRLSTF